MAEIGLFAFQKLSSEFSIRASQLVESPTEKEGDTCDGIGAAAQVTDEYVNVFLNTFSKRHPIETTVSFPF